MLYLQSKYSNYVMQTLVAIRSIYRSWLIKKYVALCVNRGSLWDLIWCIHKYSLEMIICSIYLGIYRSRQLYLIIVKHYSRVIILPFILKRMTKTSQKVYCDFVLNWTIFWQVSGSVMKYYWLNSEPHSKQWITQPHP